MGFTIEKIKVSDKPHKVARDLVLAQGRYRCIGSGAYASVFGAKGSNLVYKIGDADDDVGYMSYMKTLSKVKESNPFLPVIHGVRVYSSPEAKYYVVAMERLKTLKDTPAHHSFITLLESVLSGWAKEMCDANYLLREMCPKISHEHFHSAVSILNKAKKRSGCWDLHEGNIMLREKQFVITDPLA